MQKERYYMECQLADSVLSPEVASSLTTGNVSIIGGAVRNRIISLENTHQYYNDSDMEPSAKTRLFSSKEIHPQTADRLMGIRDIDVLISDCDTDSVAPSVLFSAITNKFNDVTKRKLAILSVKRVSPMSYVTPISKVQAQSVFYRCTFSYSFNGGITFKGENITFTMDAIYFPGNIEEFFDEAIVKADAIAMFASGEIRAFGYARVPAISTFSDNITKALELREYINDLLKGRTMINTKRLIVAGDYDVSVESMHYSFAAFIYKILRRSSLGTHFENLNLQVVSRNTVPCNASLTDVIEKGRFHLQFMSHLDDCPLRKNSSAYMIRIGESTYVSANEFIVNLFHNMTKITLSDGAYTFGIRINKPSRVVPIYKFNTNEYR